MVGKVSRLGPRPERNAVTAQSGRDAGKSGRHRERDTRAMGGAIAARVSAALALRLVVVVLVCGVPGVRSMGPGLGFMVHRAGLLLPGGADADRHRPNGARGNQRDQEEDKDDLKAAEHTVIMT